MLRSLLIFFLSLLSTSFASHDNSANSSIIFEGEPSANVAGCVNAITGDFFFSQNEIFVEGAQPLQLQRSYISGEGQGHADYDGKVHQSGWNFLSHIYVHLVERSDTLRIPEPSGAVLSYKIDSSLIRKIRKKEHVCLTPAKNPGLTNCGHRQGLPSALHNLKNNRVEFEDKNLTVYASDGSIRTYERADHRGTRDFWQPVPLDDPENPRSLYTLKEERLPSGNHQIYKYDDHQRLIWIGTKDESKTKTYAWAEITYEGYKKSYDFTIKTSDGRTYDYSWGKSRSKTFYLEEVKSAVNPQEKLLYIDLDYKHGKLLHKRIFPDGRAFQIDYYDEDSKNRHRVKAIHSSTGSGELQTTHTFSYFPGKEGKTGGHTEVFDALGNKTIYRYSAQLRLEEIESYEGRHSLHSRTRFIWDCEGNLLCKLLCDGRGEALLAHRFYYDGRGNPCEEQLFGNLTGASKPIILDGSGLPVGGEVYRKRFTYNERSLLVKCEEDNGLTTLLSYLPDFNLITSELVLDEGQIKIRRFWEYDKKHFLIREIKDDGSSENKDDCRGIAKRQIKEINRRKTPYYEPIKPHPGKGSNIGKKDYYLAQPRPPAPIRYEDMPGTIEEKYWEAGSEKLLQKVQLTYSDRGEVIRQDFFDTQENQRYSLHTAYDEQGRLSSETNALGQTTKYSYDSNSNKILIEDLSTGRRTSLAYDCANKVISTNEDDHITQYKYDLAGRKSATIDYLGQETTYIYNAFSQLIETRLPMVLNEEGVEIHPQIKREVDVLGRETALINPKGERVETSYNIHGKPTHIHYPDDTWMTFTYNLDGTPATITDQEGVITSIQNDFLGRVKTKQIFSPEHELLLEETKSYNTFHLLSQTDGMGNTTTYFYDFAGRKIAEEVNGSERIEFIYDPLGHLHATISGDKISITECDLLGRMTQERTEDKKGTILSRQLYSYDPFGNKSTITRFIGDHEATEFFEYDRFKRPVKQIDALGHTTHIAYDEQHILKKTHIDPLGMQTIETFDALSRLVCKEQKGSQGQTLSKECLFYDATGNLSRQESLVFSADRLLHTTTTRSEYGAMGRLLKLTEAAGTPEQKTTQYTYTARGERKSTIKPDGTHLLHTYDHLGRLSLLESSDHSIRYAYTYNKLHQITKSKNLITGKTTERTYDHKGRVLSEKLESGLILHNQYDQMGRRNRLILPDHSFVEYIYDPLFLREVQRKTKEGALSYKHTFDIYDLSGHLHEETLIGQAGSLHHSIDPLGRCYATKSALFQQEVKEYDPNGNIKKIDWSIADQKRTATYHYDELSQLEQETGLFPTSLTNDSHYNRLSKNDTPYTLNKLNQLVSRYTYDLNGNPLTKGAEHYTYDALDRLIEILQSDTKVTFTYDSDHRRQTRTLFTWHHGLWRPTEHHTYLYDGQNEIGAMGSTGKIIQLRILGLDAQAEIGSAIALELDGKVYVPIHDQQGNIAALLSPTGQLEEFYHYSAFGEERLFNNKGQNIPHSHNPWHFSSKRLDQESGLLYFGRRYYDPEIGRWLTPDPSSFTDSPNLYAFVLNNPLTHLDLYGLETNWKVPSALAYHDNWSQTEYVENRQHYTNQSRPFQTNASDLQKGRIGFINGIWNSFNGAMKNANYIGELAGNRKIYGVYNENIGFLHDLSRGLLGMFGYISPQAHLLQRQWMDFISTRNPWDRFFQICHSEGAIHVKNALKSFPPELRDRIIVLAIAPATIIPNHLCHRSYNYASENDLVYHLDQTKENRLYRNELIVLKKHPDASWFDHPLISPTYQSRIELHIEDYIRDYEK